MQTTTRKGTAYTFVKGLGVIKEIVEAELPNATENDAFYNITFAITRPLDDNGSTSNNDAAKIMLNNGVDEEFVNELIGGMNVRMCSCLINAANFKTGISLFETAAQNGTLLPFTAIYVPVKQAILQAGRQGDAIRLIGGSGNFARTHKWGTLGLLDDVDEYADRIMHRILENSYDYETDVEVQEEMERKNTQSRTRRDRG